MYSVPRLCAYPYAAFYVQHMNNIAQHTTGIRCFGVQLRAQERGSREDGEEVGDGCWESIGRECAAEDASWAGVGGEAVNGMA